MTTKPRVRKIHDDRTNCTTKYRMVNRYKEFWIYQEVCPSGYAKSQSYLIDGEKHLIVSHSFNNMLYDELLDCIDQYMETGEFGLRGYSRNGYFLVHSNGDETC